MGKYLGPNRGTPVGGDYSLERNFAAVFMCDLLTPAYCFEGPNCTPVKVAVSQAKGVADSLNFINFLDLLVPQVRYVLL